MRIDLNKIEDVLRALDIEGYIEYHGAPTDEYNDEAKKIHARMLSAKTTSADTVAPILTEVWVNSFNLDEDDMRKRSALLDEAVKRICAGG